MKCSSLILFIIIIAASSCVQKKQAGNQDELRAAITEHIQAYPLSTLKDIYKSFYQDNFGPGHLLQDTIAAWDYLVEEVSQMKSNGNYLAEPCGLGKNFVRVPLDVVKDSLFDIAVFYKAFVESSKSFSIPDISQWQEQWEDILEVIEGMDLNLSNFEQDKKEISEMLDRGEAVVHHSRIYAENYDPHYRLMTLEQWMALLETVHR
jgi:hypothetical protein